MKTDIPDDDGPTPPNPDDGSRRGRPTKLTDSLITSAVGLLLQGNYRCVVARLLGVGFSTFRKWLRIGSKYPDGLYGHFRAAVIAAESMAEARAVATITSAGQDDPRLLLEYLARKYPKRYGAYRGELGELKRRIAELEKVVDAVAPETPLREVGEA